jgi:hypothetical protein
LTNPTDLFLRAVPDWIDRLAPTDTPLLSRMGTCVRPCVAWATEHVTVPRTQWWIYESEDGETDIWRDDVERPGLTPIATYWAEEYSFDRKVCAAYDDSWVEPEECRTITWGWGE